MSLLLLLGCFDFLVPELYSKDSASGWEAPDNRWYTESPPSDLVEEGFGRQQVVQDLRMMDQFGDEVSLWQFYGQLVLLDISAEWCAPCKLLAEETEETWEDYEASGFTYLTLLAEDNSSNLPSTEVLDLWATEFEISQPVMSPTVDYRPILVPNGAYPKLILIGRDLRVIKSNINPPEDATVRAAIEESL